MKRTTFLPIGFLALALAGSGAIIATAQTAPVTPDAPAAEADADARVVRAHSRADGHGGERKMHRGHHRGHHGGRGHGGGEMMRTLFDAVDTDQDRTVTQAEVDAYRADKLAQVDASGDGALSIEEFDTLYREFTRSRMVDMFQDLDADGDGIISPDEMDTRVARMFERMDRDGDGALTLQRRGGGRGASEAPEADTDN